MGYFLTTDFGRFLPTLEWLLSPDSNTIAIDAKLEADLMPLMDVPGPFLFGGDRSLPINSVQRYFTQAIKDSGVPPIRLQDLRHSHATLLINSGVNIVAVSRRLGHASIEQTLTTYTHLLQ